MSLMPFFDDFDDDFFNRPMIPAGFPWFSPAPYYHHPNRRSSSRGPSTSLERRFTDFSPKINLSEDEGHYYIHADLPGLTKDQVKMEIGEDRTFTISGERESVHDSDKPSKEEGQEGQEGQDKKSSSGKKGKTYHRIECSYGKFSRSFSLPENADLNEVQAKMENGVLSVTFNKIEPPKSQKRTIQIQ